MHPRYLVVWFRSTVFGSVPRQALCLFVIILFSYLTVFFIPVRNVVFRYYIYKAWQNVSTPDIIKMHYIRPEYPLGVYTKVECGSKWRPTVRRKDIATDKIHVYKTSHDTGLVHEALSKGHGRYLPFMNMDRIFDYLYLFKVMKEALDLRNIPFFMTAGSILGATRHGGFIPWDDDLDFGIDIKRWDDVKQALSCVDKFSLQIFAPLHWKFSFTDRSYPYIDIFFYSKNGPYLWAMTHYISKTFIYPENLVFPLVEVDFEGVLMPMPGHGLEIARRIYENYSECVVSEGHVKSNRSLMTDVYPDGYSKTHVPCKDLQYLYSMTNIDLDNSSHV